MPADAYEQLKRRLCDLLQRNREFRALLLAGNIQPTQVGDMTFGTLATDDQLDMLPSPSKFFNMVRTTYDILWTVYFLPFPLYFKCALFNVRDN